MDCFLEWSPEALDDVELIASYIERGSLWYAKIVVSKIVSAAETIRLNRDIGRIVPEVADKNIRELFVYSYRLIYRIEPERVVIAAVIHASRLLQPFVSRIEGGK
ncbi:MAG: type II toxin-antitoxin system RelE/ParE family toxin [Chlorobiaceae bacterium]|nr:type II toxin-antitoxin system RelE/ParE family toxin [Chlorobiaceae bacterium]